MTPETAMTSRMPPFVYLLGVAGLIPFVACGIAALSPGSSQGAGLIALIGYAAVVLGFLGGVHWGLVLAPAASPLLQRARLVLGVAPALIGWLALVLAVMASPEFGLAVVIVGYIATVVVESRWARLEVLPGGYMALRWGVSVVVIITLVTVLGLRLIGASITF